MSTIDYYRDHAARYAARTWDLDVSALYPAFLAHVPRGGSILDVGSGSGRDGAAFQRLGYRVLGIDASPDMCIVSGLRSLVSVRCLRVEEVPAAWADRFDGVWACASLLHVADVDLYPTLRRLLHVLRNDGWIYASFREGVGMRTTKDGRTYLDMTGPDLKKNLEIAGFVDAHTWTTADVSGRDITWVHGLARTAG